MLLQKSICMHCFLYFNMALFDILTLFIFLFNVSACLASFRTMTKWLLNKNHARRFCIILQKEIIRFKMDWDWCMWNISKSDFFMQIPKILIFLLRQNASCMVIWKLKKSFTVNNTLIRIKMLDFALLASCMKYFLNLSGWWWQSPATLSPRTCRSLV